MCSIAVDQEGLRFEAVAARNYSGEAVGPIVPALGEADAEVRASFDRFCLAAGIEARGSDKEDQAAA